jgi:type II secretory pathway component GspD/PulD (secretin)
VLSFNNSALRDIFTAISVSTGINITYDTGLEGVLARPHTLNVQNVPLEQVLNQLMGTFALTFKVIDAKTIFIYADNAGNRQKYEDLYQQTFYLSHADVTEVSAILNQMLTTTTGGGNRPVVTQHKTLNAINVRASAPMMGLIKNIIDTADKPRAEVLIDVSILEVSRTRLRNLGIDLSSYAIGLAFSPEVAPSATAGNSLPNAPPNPPQISAGSFSGASRNDTYVSIPTAVIRLLESDQRTRLLAKPQLRGREGAALTLNLGDDIPVPTTSFLPIATGGVPTQPQVSFQYRPVGVNLSMTPRVTFQDEIVLDPITIDKSSLGPNIEISGNILPRFVSRRAQVTMRLRDGESNLLAGLILEEDRETARSLPGINRIPILRSLFGNTDSANEQTDVIMIVTPHIIRGREITAADLAPFYVGTSNNLGAGTAPTLISPNAPPPPTIPPPGGAGTTPPPPTAGQPPVTGGAATPPAQTGAGAQAANPRAANIVPIEQVGAKPPAPTGTVLLAVVPDAPLQLGGAPYTVPLSVQGASQLGSITVSVTYDPKVVRATAVSQGTFLQQGGIQTVFAPKIDEANGRIDFVITRPGSSPGAAGSGPLASLSFQGIAAGTSQVRITATGLTPTGQPITVTGAPVTLIVK